LGKGAPIELNVDIHKPPIFFIGEYDMKKNITFMLVIFFSSLLILYSTNTAMASSRLKVNCNLEGAEVSLDGKFKGECPVEFDVSAGKHNVVVRKNLDDGSYYYYERETRVGEDVVQEINAALERIYTEQYYWKRAEEQGTIESYGEYLKKYPEGTFAKNAKLKIEQYYWDRAEKHGEIEYYEEYLRRYPEGKFAKNAKLKIEEQVEKLKMKIKEKLPLRSEPLVVLKAQAQKVFGLDKNLRPREYIAREYIENNFESLGDVVIDHVTGLMWQRSGSYNKVRRKNVRAHINRINAGRFAGYNDWRLPTIEELMSLLEPEKWSSDLYINPIFDARQSQCWSADKDSSGQNKWLVDFRYGVVCRVGDMLYSSGYGGGYSYVRVVRAYIPQKQEKTPLPTPVPTATPQQQEKTTTQKIGIVVTEQDALNIRSGSGKQYKIIGSAGKDTKLNILEELGEWYKVQLSDGTIGYATSQYIKIFDRKDATSAHEPSEIPSWLNRKLRQKDQWKAEIIVKCLEIDNICGSIDFRDLQCGGDLKYIGQKDNGFLFMEKLKYGRCVEGCYIWMNSDGTQYKEFCANRETGSGSLINEGEILQTIESEKKRDKDTNSQGIKEATSNFEGTWTGTGNQDNGSSWTIKITITPNHYLIEYPSISCGGELTLLEETPNLMKFKEKITYGRTNCIDGGIVEITKTSEHTAKYNWLHSRGTAVGNLNRF